MSLSSANRSMQLLVRLLDSKNTTEPMEDFGVQKPEIPLGRSSQSLPREIPEREGIPSRQIADFLQELDRDPTLGMHSILILRHGKVLCEAAFGAQLTELPRMTFSACKSITAMAIGLLMDDGLLSADDRLTDLFAADLGPLAKRLMKDLTLEHLLSMQTGNLFNEVNAMTEHDWIHGFCLSPALTDPRDKFQYNSLNTYMLAVLVTRITGKSLSDFLTERLFEPMGIGDFYWEVCPQGIEKGGWGLYMKPEDLAKLGQLVLDDGCWNGQRLLSAEFLDRATRVHSQVPESYGDYNYGWQMWVGRQENTVLFNGMLGQNVLCFRDSGIIVVSHAGNSETFQQSNYFKLVSRFFGGTFPQSLPRSLTAERDLNRTLEALCDCTGSVPTREQFNAFAGKRFLADDPRAASAGLLPLALQAVENCYSKGMEAVTIGGSRTQISLFYEERDQFYHVIAGIKEPVYQILNFGGNEFRVAAQARFTHDEDENPVLRVRLDFLEAPCSRILKLCLRPKGPVLRQQETPGVEYLLDTMVLSAPNAASKALLTSLLGSSDADYLHWKMDQVFSPTLRMKEDK